MDVTVTRWWWIRHAPVTDDGGCFYGQKDVPAYTGDTPVYRALAAALPPDAVWVSSHLQRTHQTAAAIGNAGYALPEVAQYEDLAEQHFGDWQGRPRAPAYEKYGSFHGFWMNLLEEAPPNGESFRDLRNRVGGGRPPVGQPSRPGHRRCRPRRHDPGRPRQRPRSAVAAGPQLHHRQQLAHPDGPDRGAGPRPPLGRQPAERPRRERGAGVAGRSGFRRFWPTHAACLRILNVVTLGRHPAGIAGEGLNPPIRPGASLLRDPGGRGEHHDK